MIFPESLHEENGCNPVMIIQFTVTIDKKVNL
jgi:hypothetical protein